MYNVQVPLSAYSVWAVCLQIRRSCEADHVQGCGERGSECSPHPWAEGGGGQAEGTTGLRRHRRWRGYGPLAASTLFLLVLPSTFSVFVCLVLFVLSPTLCVICLFLLSSQSPTLSVSLSDMSLSVSLFALSPPLAVSVSVWSVNFSVLNLQRFLSVCLICLCPSVSLCSVAQLSLSASSVFVSLYRDLVLVLSYTFLCFFLLVCLCFIFV